MGQQQTERIGEESENGDGMKSSKVESERVENIADYGEQGGDS